MPPTATGSEGNALEALNEVKAVVNDRKVLAAGVDAPLYWSIKGDRDTDKVIRRMLTLPKVGFTSNQANGTVQTVNSLRGSCTIEGLWLARCFDGAFSEARLTEAHPKALYFLLKANLGCMYETCRKHFNRLTRFLEDAEKTGKIESSKVEISSDGRARRDKRDAALAAFAAWSMLNQSQLSCQVHEWSDLYKYERCQNQEGTIQPFCTPVSYWMPIQP